MNKVSIMYSQPINYNIYIYTHTHTRIHTRQYMNKVTYKVKMGIFFTVSSQKEMEMLKIETCMK
jgi:hypothetical protein